LAGDGILFVEESLLNRGWFPQPTPRRFFAVLWTTGAVRLLGLIDPTQIEFGSILFGIFGYLQILLPTALILRSSLAAATKFLLLSLFLSATVISSNFIVSESLFLLALTHDLRRLYLGPFERSDVPASCTGRVAPYRKL